MGGKTEKCDLYSRGKVIDGNQSQDDSEVEISRQGL